MRAQKPETLVAFEVGPWGLRLVEMLRDERRVLSAGSIPFAPGRWRDREHFAAHVRSTLDTIALGRPTRIIASVPLGHAHLRVVEVPEDAGDPRAHLAWDMGLYLARPAEAYALDFVPLPVRGADGSRAWLAAAFRRDEAVGLRETLEAASGAPLAALDVDAVALVNAASACLPEARGERTVIAAVNLASTALIRTQGGALLGTTLRRDAGDTGAALRPEADAQERAETLLRRVRGIAEDLAALEEGWEKPDRLLLCGDLAADPDFLELLHYRFPAQATSFESFNPFAAYPAPPEFSEPGAPYAVAMGLALRLMEEP